MSCDQSRKIIVFLCIISVSFFNVNICSSLTVGQLRDVNEENTPEPNRRKVNNPRVGAKEQAGYFGKRVLLGRLPRPTFTKTYTSDPSEQRFVLYDKNVPHHSSPGEFDEKRVSNPSDLRSPWIFRKGNEISQRDDVDKDYQADFRGLTDFDGYVGQGKVSGPTAKADFQSSAWWAMRPLVQCEGNFMILTATGQGYIHLLVDRVDASPISLFQLPTHCGYSVKTTWKDLTMVAPYDSCYMTKENGNYVLPMLWWGSPVKISCPAPAPPPKPPPPSAPPSVLCSYSGMAIRVQGGVARVPTLRVKVNRKWTPLVSNECAYRVASHPDELIFFCPFTAPCMTHRHGAHLRLWLDGQEVTLTCPHAPPQFPHWPSPPFSHHLPPNDPHTHYQAPLSPPEWPPIPTPALPILSSPPPQPSGGPQYPPVPQYLPGPYDPRETNDRPRPVPATESPVSYTLEPALGPEPDWDPGRYYPYLPPIPAPQTAIPPPSPFLQCLEGQVVAKLPSAHPDSIEVKGHGKKWKSIFSAPADCGYVVQREQGSWVSFYSPLPACHSYFPDSMTISLHLRYWDIHLQQHRALELQCPQPSAPRTPFPPPPPPPPPPTTTPQPWSRPPAPPKIQVFCSAHHMSAELPPGPISGIVVMDVKGNEMSLDNAPRHCGYRVSQGKDGCVRLHLPFNSCHMTVVGQEYQIHVVYTTLSGEKGEALLSCPVSITLPTQECHIPSGQRLPCGSGVLSEKQCRSRGCCFSTHLPRCYYSMDECTADRHFVFSVPASLTDPPLAPALLVAAGDASCTPQRVTPDNAVFKIPLEGCGAHRYEVGKTVIYLVEIINQVQTITLNYGTITRESPVRLMVECRYLPGSVVSVGYLVKTPSLGPAIQAGGVFGVQLRIATDSQYTSYYPQYHRPLQMLLGKPLYLEVRLLNPPDPDVLLLVHYCVAYPRSGHATWVLLYNGCPNPLDPVAQLPPLPPPAGPKGQTRRFTISTFQFLPDGKATDPDEEIYFMCSTEVCSPADGPCVEGCFGQ